MARLNRLIVAFSAALVVLTSLVAVSAEFIQPSVWPKPKSFSTGQSTSRICPLHFKSVNGKVKTLSDAYDRYSKLMFPHAGVDESSVGCLRAVAVTVEDNSEAYPQLDTDESYTLTIPSSARTGRIEITASTVYGAVRALETLSQLVRYEYSHLDGSSSGFYYVPATPISIDDAPRYKHRGMLLDTARHFQPISFLQSTIDALSYAKYNVLHWHIVDTQAFPFESVSFPRLWQGAYTSQERYTQQDIEALVEYGRQRGVKLMIEFDVPGHAASWCTGYPDICPSMQCKQPLDPSSNQTFAVIEGLLAECTTSSNPMFPYQFVHLGGDEVSYTCWEKDPDIQQWQADNGIEDSEGTYEYFVDRVASITRQLKRTPVQWVEVFEHFGAELDKDTVIHVWKEKSTLDGVLSAGYQALLSNQGLWYLDHLDTTWDDMYGNEPTSDLSATSDPSLILGGESCMWGETVDASDVENTVWPRAAAVAEVLWTPYDQIYRSNSSSGDSINWEETEDRLETFRCLLTERGVAAAPVTNKEARFAPKEPGSCYVQRRRL